MRAFALSTDTAGVGGADSSIDGGGGGWQGGQVLVGGSWHCPARGSLGQKVWPGSFGHFCGVRLHLGAGPGGEGAFPGEGKRLLLNAQTSVSTAGRCSSGSEGAIGLECEAAKTTPCSIPLMLPLPVHRSARAWSVPLALNARFSQVASTERQGASVLSSVPSSRASKRLCDYHDHNGRSK
jgi:hypothetical protein